MNSEMRSTEARVGGDDAGLVINGNSGEVRPLVFVHGHLFIIYFEYKTTNITENEPKVQKRVER